MSLNSDQKLLISYVEKLKNKKIVFTNGCFDILHAGHIQYLNQAKKLGDVLVVGLNSDESIRRLKGNSRPINNQSDRMYVLENLKSVDFVHIFDDDTPLEIIKLIHPTTLVKGGDWKEEDIVGADIVKSYNGTVKSLSFKAGFSTTNIIDKIKKS